MHKWRLIKQTWCSWPSRPIGIIEMIGGSYLSTTPHISYKVLLEGLIKKQIAVHTWRYIPGLDHQSQANKAWLDFRICKQKLEGRVGKLPAPLRIGHSLGCKLHLLAPDLGRNSQAFIGLSFNNFNANQSIPMLNKVTKKLNIRTEFSPSPKETISLISKKYIQPRNLLIKFNNDNLDQTALLLNSLKHRSKDETISLELEGNHLTPANTGFKKRLLDSLTESSNNEEKIHILIDTIYNYLTN